MMNPSLLSLEVTASTIRGHAALVFSAFLIPAACFSKISISACKICSSVIPLTSAILLVFNGSAPVVSTGIRYNPEETNLLTVTVNGVAAPIGGTAAYENYPRIFAKLQDRGKPAVGANHFFGFIFFFCIRED